MFLTVSSLHRYRHDPDSANGAVAVPVWDLLDRGGKRWRVVLCMLVAEALGGKPKDVADVAAAIEIIHNGTLMLDDVEDQSSVRRCDSVYQPWCVFQRMCAPPAVWTHVAVHRNSFTIYVYYTQVLSAINWYLIRHFIENSLTWCFYFEESAMHPSQIWGRRGHQRRLRHVFSSCQGSFGPP